MKAAEVAESRAATGWDVEGGGGRGNPSHTPIIVDHHPDQHDRTKWWAITMQRTTKCLRHMLAQIYSGRAWLDRISNRN